MPGRNPSFALVVCAVIGLLPACGQGTSGEDAAAPEDPAAGASINRSGTDGGMYYSCQSSGGAVSFSLDGPNGYSAKWSNVQELFCGRGWSAGSATRTVTWAGTYSHTGGGAYGLYGWALNPIIEYYVVEKSGAAGSPAGGTMLGSYATDGSTYVVYRHQQVNQPCITGNACTFYQIVAVRQAPRTSGSITFQNHVNAWKQLGVHLGTLGYQLLLTEAWQGSGSASAKIGACCTTPGPGGLVPQ